MWYKGHLLVCVRLRGVHVRTFSMVIHVHVITRLFIFGTLSSFDILLRNNARNCLVFMIFEMVMNTG